MKTIEALVGGYVDKELLIRNEYMAVENENLKSKFEKPKRIRLTKIGRRVSLKELRVLDALCSQKPP